MTVSILCPNLKCRMVLAVPDDTRGKKVRCKYCGMTFAVPTKEQGNEGGKAKKIPAVNNNP
ncbi:MAG: hypothetical protein WC975_11405 [Phycisphaerae bacterium]